MDSVTVNRELLLNKVKENRAEHREIFEEAVEGYKKRAVELLEEHIERIKNGKLERVMVSLPLPVDHTKDYDRVITMLELHVEDTVEIKEHDFGAYVMDDWSWKTEFLTSSSLYSAKAASLATP